MAQALRKFPQCQSIEWRGLPLGRSQYHALEVVLEQHLSTFCAPNTNFSSPAFGTVNTQCNQARSVQFGLRLDY